MIPKNLKKLPRNLVKKESKWNPPNNPKRKNSKPPENPYELLSKQLRSDHPLQPTQSLLTSLKYQMIVVSHWIVGLHGYPFQLCAKNYFLKSPNSIKNYNNSPFN